jgi:tetratricopeptide (TPR) repeat protein
MKRATGVLLAVLLVFALAGCGQPSAVSSAAAPTYQEQYDLGVKYLSEGNYQEAVAAFTAAIEIEANHAEAYTGRGDGYVGLAKGDGAKAQEKYRSAEPDYLKAIELDAKQAAAYGKLADVYIALGENDKAREILQKGVDATGDTDLQARLDAFDVTADPANLTGQPPFALSTLETWGYPRGISIYDLQARGEFSDQSEFGTVDEFIHRNKDGLGLAENKSCGEGLHRNPDIYISLYDFSIFSVEIQAGDTVPGPAGITLGMSMEEVLRRFRCDEPKALAFAQTHDRLLLEEATTNDGTKFRQLDLYLLNPDNISGYGSWVGLLYAALYEQSDGSLNLDYQVQGKAELTVKFQSGIVSDIHVGYLQPAQ